MADGSPLILGQDNQSNNSTRITRGPGVGLQFLAPAVVIDNRQGREQGLLAFSSGEGLVGQGQNGSGVVGVSFNLEGVRGEGVGTNNGVTGRCDAGTGVFGETTSGNGIMGDSLTGVGVLGRAHSATSGAGVVGVAGVPPGFNTSGRAGVFFGSVAIVGNFHVFNGGKSAAVPHRDGSHRTLYSMESPESWFEDFGTSRLVRGRAKVKLDRDFVAVIRAGTYHVFLTPEGDSNGLYISAKTKGAFEVREQQSGKNSVRFSYRVVAKRKDIPGKRFAKVKLPNLSDLPQPLKRSVNRKAFKLPE